MTTSDASADPRDPGRLALGGGVALRGVGVSGKLMLTKSQAAQVTVPVFRGLADGVLVTHADWL